MKDEHSPANVFTGRLGMDERSAMLLVDKGVTSLEELAYVPVAELAEVEGLNSAFIAKFRQLAREHLNRGLGGEAG